MPDATSIREWTQDLWCEIRSDRRPVIAPYPERAVPPSWKWDRPVDLLLGRAMAAPIRKRPPLLARAERIAESSQVLLTLDDATLDARCADMRAR